MLLIGSWLFHASREMSTSTMTPYNRASIMTFQLRITLSTGQQMTLSLPLPTPYRLKTMMFRPACLRRRDPVATVMMTLTSASATTICCRRTSDPPATSTVASLQTVLASHQSCQVDRCRPAAPVSAQPSHRPSASVEAQQRQRPE